MIKDRVNIKKHICLFMILALMSIDLITLEPLCVYANESEDKIVSVSLGAIHSAVIKNDGTLWMWGNNCNGQLGNGNDDNSNVPIKVLEGVKSVSLGGYHSAAIKEDGTLWMWGNNYRGQLGNEGDNDSNVPIKVLEGVKSVSLGDMHSAAIKEDGTLWMWGDNYYGQLGNGNNNDSNVPIKVLEGVKSVSLGYNHSAAIKEDGTLWMWGYNYRGQLGNEGDNDSNVPIKVLEGVKSVSLGDMHSAAIKEDGSLWIWGDNDYGQLGNGKDNMSDDGFYGRDSDSNVPIKVLDGVKSVSLGDKHSAAIKEDGSLWMWGFGELGNGKYASSSNIPIRIAIGASESVTPEKQTDDTNKGEGVISPTKNTLFDVKLTKVTKGKKSFTAKWKKASKMQQKEFSGYQIQYSITSDFSRKVKTKSTTKKNASRVVIRKLKKKTTYYVRIRRFKKSGGKKIYSDWSSVKRVKTK